jgi:hypothetical protein
MRSRCALGAFSMVTMTMVFHAAVSRAQDLTAEAQARFHEGVKAYEHHEFEHARLAFLQSLALVERGSVLRNLGLAEIELHRPIEALHHLRAALKLPDLDAARRAVTDRDIRDAYAATGHIGVQTADGATVTVDGEAVDGKAPFQDPIDVMPGRHVLRASLADRAAHTDVEARAGILVVASLPIEPAVTAPGSSPPAVAVVEPVVTTARAGEGSAFERYPFWNVRREIGAAAMVAGVASAVVGVYFYTQAIDAQNRANAAHAGLGPSSCVGSTQPQACAAANDAWSTQSTDAALNYVFLGVGAASLVTGIAMIAWPESRSSLAIAPVFTPVGGGLHLRGEF